MSKWIEDNAITIIIALLIFGLSLVFISITTIRYQHEAVKAGAAHYEAGPNGEPKFVWGKQ